MTLAREIRGTARRAALRCGGGNEATIRRDGDGILSGATGAVLTSLSVNGTVAVGGSSLDLDAASIRPGSVLGRGWQFTLPGHTAPYEVQADVTVSANNFSGVSISPVLSHEATDDSTATITQQYGEWSFKAFRREFLVDEMDDRFEADDYILVVDVTGASFTDFGLADAVLWDGGARRTIVRRMPIKPGDDLAAMRLHCRG